MCVVAEIRHSGLGEECRACRLRREVRELEAEVQWREDMEEEEEEQERRWGR